MTVVDPNSESEKARAAIDPIVPIGVVAGLALGFITDLASKTDIGGPNWSLRGNGAIAVLFGLGGALLAFGWLSLAYGSRGERGFLNRVLAGALAVLVLEVAFAFVPITLGPDAALQFQIVLIVVPLAIALAVGLLLARGGLLAGGALAAAALAACLAPLGLQFFLIPLFLPIVVAMPSLARAANGWLVGNSVAVLIALLVGLYGAQALANR